MTSKDKAKLMLAEIKNALDQGTQHYRVSDHKLLEDPKEILETLLNERAIEIIPVSCRN